MNLQEIEQQYNQYTGMYHVGDITKEEYVNLLQGLEVEKAVSMNAEELQFKENLNLAINAAITAVKALA